MIIGEQYLLSEPRMVIGRSDPSSSIYPDIDLTGQDNEYVHRRHALLQFYDLDTRLSVEHVGGTNPTLVNNQPVEAGELVELKIGDRLRIGRVVMRLTSI
ncbi:MAG: FHA domain-containing protein [Bradymonadales bacterium]|nr:FHA domain-containing protein [Bradymonadales bacterium]